jgi:integrative and conjugative element protein (TIGR02256 family)
VLRARRRRLSAGLLWLPRSAVEQMREQADARAPLEHGGMLLGWESDGQLVVSRLVGAGPHAKASRNSFAADGAWQQVQLERIYAASGRTVTYLGDWHSHPHGSRRPSKRDRETAAGIARHRGSRASEPVTLIFHRGVRGWAPYPYRLTGGRFRKLTVMPYPQRSRPA